MNGKNVLNQQTMQMNSLLKENFDKQVCLYFKENFKNIFYKISLGKVSDTDTVEQKQSPTTSTRKTPTLRYNAKKD